jgi:hypothetical protein
LIKGQGFLTTYLFGEPDMPKAVHISTPIPASAASSEESRGSPLVSVALFCGIGLLMSLVAILMGDTGVWY